MFCKNCGSPLNPNDRFCNICGQTNDNLGGPQPQNEQQNNVQNMNQVPQGYSQPVQNGYNQVPQGNLNPNQGYQQPMQNGYNQVPQGNLNPQGYPQPVQNGYYQQPQPEKKSNTGFIILVVVLGLAIVGVILYLLLRQPTVVDKPAPTNNGSNQTQQPTGNETISNNNIFEKDGYRFNIPSGYVVKDISGTKSLINQSSKTAIFVYAHSGVTLTTYKNSITQLKDELTQKGLKVTGYETKYVDGVELLILYGTAKIDQGTISFAIAFSSIGAYDVGEYDLYSYTTKNAKNFVSDIAAVAKNVKYTGSSSFSPVEGEEKEAELSFEVLVDDEFKNDLPSEVEE